MSAALPLRSHEPRAVILKLYNTDYTLDPYGDRLISQGYDVINASNYAEAIKLARQYNPVLILVYDDPNANVDAVQWLQLQHEDRVGRLAMIPLLILADAERVPELRLEEIADRVVVLQRRADTLNQVTRTVKRLLRVWGLDEQS